MFNKRKATLSEKKGQCGTMSQLQDLETLINRKKSDLLKTKDLGTCAATADNLLQDNLLLQDEAAGISERCLNCIKSSESSTTMQSSVKAYTILEQSADYQHLLELRSALLTQSSSYFTYLKSVNYSLDQVEVQLNHANQPNWGDILKDMDCMMLETTSQGNSILNQSPKGSEGIALSLETLKTRMNGLKATCQLKQSQFDRSNEAIRSFTSKLIELEAWITSAGFRFLETNGDFGSGYESAVRFRDSHQDLNNRVHMKSYELEGLRGALKTVAGQCSTDGSRQVEMQMQNLQQKLTQLKQRLDKRIAISDAYVKFHKLCVQVDNEMNVLEHQLKADNASFSSKHYEESRLLIQQLFLQACNLGKNSGEDIMAMDDQNVDKDSATDCIQTQIKKLNVKQSSIIEHWKRLDCELKEGQKIEEEWAEITKEVKSSLANFSDIDDQLFPIIRNVQSSELTLNQIEDKASKMSKFKIIPDRIYRLLRKVEDIVVKFQGPKQLDGQRLADDLKLHHSQLQVWSFEFTNRFALF